jgi:hypothetical protein
MPVSASGFLRSHRQILHRRSGDSCGYHKIILQKLKNEKAGLAVILDRELQELFSKNTGISIDIYSGGARAICHSYYHQKQDTWKKAKSNAD